MSYQPHWSHSQASQPGKWRLIVELWSIYGDIIEPMDWHNWIPMSSSYLHCHTHILTCQLAGDKTAQLWWLQYCYKWKKTSSDQKTWPLGVELGLYGRRWEEEEESSGNMNNIHVTASPLVSFPDLFSSTSLYIASSIVTVIWFGVSLTWGYCTHQYIQISLQVYVHMIGKYSSKQFTQIIFSYQK